MNRIARKLQYDFPNAVLPISWTWPKPPPVDALKDSMAQRIQLENGTKSFTQVCAENGDRSDEVIRLRKKDNAELAANDLPPIIGALPVTDVELIKSIYALDEDEPDATQDEPTEPANATETDSTPTEAQ
jgi:capsid protein